MTREELKTHCEKQIENCEMWARCKGEEPHGKMYEEHKLILELLEQESVVDRIKENIQFIKDKCLPNNIAEEYEQKGLQEALDIINKYKAESEDT